MLENFIFTGKFQLPVGTPIAYIEDLAHETIANLGLVNVANNIVGDVTRRGVSGGKFCTVKMLHQNSTFWK